MGEDRLTHQRLRELRVAHGFSQRQMADLLGLSVAGYCRIETGEVRIKPDREHALRTFFAAQAVVGTHAELKDPAPSTSLGELPRAALLAARALQRKLAGDCHG